MFTVNSALKLKSACALRIMSLHLEHLKCIGFLFKKGVHLIFECRPTLHAGLSWERETFVDEEGYF